MQLASGVAVSRCCPRTSSLVVKGASRCRPRAYSLMMKVWQVLFGNNNLVVAPMADEMSRMRLSIGGRRGAAVNFVGVCAN